MFNQLISYNYQIVLWIIVWIVVWSIFNGMLKSHNINYRQSSLYTWIFFVLFSIIPLLFIKSPSIWSLLICALFLQVFYLILSKQMKAVVFMSSKNGDLIFQQLMFLWMFELYTKLNIALAFTAFWGIVFFLLHLPIIFLPHIHLKKLLFPFTFIGGIVFGFWISNFQEGILFAFLTHTLFYILLLLKYKQQLD